MPPQKLRKIAKDISLDDLEKDAGRYAQLAREQGASDAHVIDAPEVVVDDRVALKCRIPKCFGYGTSAHCPPHSLKPDETRNLVGQYHKAVVFKLDVPPDVIVRDKATIKQRVQAYSTVAGVVDAIESAAFYDGYYLAVGFAAGSCKSTFCYNADCAVLAGEKCRRALKARPSMEAVSIDCYKLATKLGWDIYPIGSDAPPECIPNATLMGLILIA